jgi:DNA polymerase-3 subunit alpha
MPSPRCQLRHAGAGADRSRNLFGLVKFYSAARSKGIKPLLGSDVFIANETDPDRPYRLLLLCRSRQGYLQLCELLSRAYLAPRVRGRAEISRRMLQEVGVDGLIALSGAAAGDVGEALLQGNREQAVSRARRWEALFRGAFYLEVQRYGQPQQEVLVAATADLAAELELPLVATHPIQFLERDDFKAHEARVCIAEGYMLGDARRPRLYTEEQYFKSAEEMVELFADLPDALGELGRNRQALQSADHARQELPAGFPDATRRDARRFPASGGGSRPGGAPAAALP